MEIPIKKTILYMRVSTVDQNYDRQQNELLEWVKKNHITEYEIISEKVSGVVPAKDRRLADVLERNDIDRLVVTELDRLGRDAYDINTTISILKEKGIELFLTGINMGTHINGKENFAFNIVKAVLAEIADLRRVQIRETQAKGIAAARLRGAYKGRQAGSSEPPGKKLEKYPEVVKELKRGTSIRRIAKLCDVSTTTVQRVKKAMKHQ